MWKNYNLFFQCTNISLFFPKRIINMNVCMFDLAYKINPNLSLSIPNKYFIPQGFTKNFYGAVGCKVHLVIYRNTVRCQMSKPMLLRFSKKILFLSTYSDVTNIAIKFAACTSRQPVWAGAAGRWRRWGGCACRRSSPPSPSPTRAPRPPRERRACWFARWGSTNIFDFFKTIYSLLLSANLLVTI